MVQLGPPPLSGLISLLPAKISLFATVAPQQPELQVNTLALSLLIGTLLAFNDTALSS